MTKIKIIPPKEYLDNKGIAYKETSNELITKCVFCEKDNHLYLNATTGQYHCKRCGEKGNLITLARHLGDDSNTVNVNYAHRSTTTNPKPKKRLPATKFDTVLVKNCHLALPEHIKQYLHNRGIVDTTIEQFKLGYGKFYGRYWITIPIKDINGNFVFFKLARDPKDETNKIKYITYPKGSEATIFNWEILNKADQVIICEGEFDCMMLYQKGVPAITSTAGAGTFKQEWLKHFNSLERVYLCFDLDEAGRIATEKVGQELSQINDLKIFNITLPKELGDKGDITDYFLNNGKGNDLFNKYAKEIDYNKNKRIRQIDKPKKEIDFNEWQEVIKNNFPDLLFPAEIGLSIMAQILIKDITNPFALVLVDVPSAGKTICINFFAEIDGLTYATDKFSPASFVSNAANVAKEKLKDVDLLPKLRYKMFLLRDLATLFSKREEDLKELLGILTRVLDGEGLNTDSGIHGQRQYVGEYLFMLLAGSTPIPPRVWKTMGNFRLKAIFPESSLQRKKRRRISRAIKLVIIQKERKAKSERH